MYLTSHVASHFICLSIFARHLADVLQTLLPSPLGAKQSIFILSIPKSLSLHHSSDGMVHI